MRPLWIVACVNAGLAVGVGALGAHALKDVLTPVTAETFRTGTLYHLVHGGAAVFALLAAGPRARWASGSFLLGCALFAGSLYGLALGGPRLLGAVAPLGGAAFLAGWIILATASVTSTEA